MPVVSYNFFYRRSTRAKTTRLEEVVFHFSTIVETRSSVICLTHALCHPIWLTLQWIDKMVYTSILDLEMFSKKWGYEMWENILKSDTVNIFMHLLAYMLCRMVMVLPLIFLSAEMFCSKMYFSFTITFTFSLVLLCFINFLLAYNATTP